MDRGVKGRRKSALEKLLEDEDRELPLKAEPSPSRSRKRFRRNTTGDTTEAISTVGSAPSFITAGPRSTPRRCSDAVGRFTS
ncbi:hypothetical protein EYF80_059899 [Liparis tanakae]|uniref:Uncharacterized protein n=1 Tax=Liparis tanakae TaxID=230148 RepID=A0A4Z2EN10_9TELE|nr:hypothetical protein EYF80_059899 [Liparis tanakae]